MTGLLFKNIKQDHSVKNGKKLYGLSVTRWRISEVLPKNLEPNQKALESLYLVLPRT